MKRIMNLLLIAALSFGALSFYSCANKKAESADEQTTNDEESDKGSSDDAANPFAKMEELSKQMQENGGVVKEVVNFRELKDLLPESIDGLKGSSTGETAGAMGFKLSKAEGDYRKEGSEKSYDVAITDVGGMGMAMMGVAFWASAEMDREDDTSYERTSTYKGHKSYEKYDKVSKRGEKSIIVANRFVVTVNGDQVSMDDINDAIDKINLGKLEGLGK